MQHWQWPDAVKLVHHTLNPVAPAPLPGWPAWHSDDILCPCTILLRLKQSRTITKFKKFEFRVRQPFVNKEFEVKVASPSTYIRFYLLLPVC